MKFWPMGLTSSDARLLIAAKVGKLPPDQT